MISAWKSFRACKNNCTTAISKGYEGHTDYCYGRCSRWQEVNESSFFCMLLEAFVEAGPQLLLQLYVIDVSGWGDKWNIGNVTDVCQF